MVELPPPSMYPSFYIGIFSSSFSIILGKALCAHAFLLANDATISTAIQWSTKINI